MADRAGPPSGVIARAPARVLVLGRAERDLAALDAGERRAVIAQIDRLAADSFPRGAAPMHDPGGHLRLHAGRFRLLYRVRDGVLTLVAITAGS
jgi:mRNA-degrading endonuclease RelE of RelBE toxin-antitoxin system